MKSLHVRLEKRWFRSWLPSERWLTLISASDPDEAHGSWPHGLWFFPRFGKLARGSAPGGDAAAGPGADAATGADTATGATIAS
jgi:hypothetical protein